MYIGGGVSFPVRGCISVARDGCARGPNPREGIHGSPRIARIARISEKRICGDMRGLRAICEVAVHRWFLTERRYENYESVLVHFVPLACFILHFLKNL